MNHTIRLCIVLSKNRLELVEEAGDSFTDEELGIDSHPDVMTASDGALRDGSSNESTSNSGKPPSFTHSRSGGIRSEETKREGVRLPIYGNVKKFEKRLLSFHDLICLISHMVDQLAPSCMVYKTLLTLRRRDRSNLCVGEATVYKMSVPKSKQ